MGTQAHLGLEVLLPAPNEQNDFNLPSVKLEMELQDVWRQCLPKQNPSQFGLYETALARKQGKLQVRGRTPQKK